MKRVTPWIIGLLAGGGLGLLAPTAGAASVDQVISGDGRITVRWSNALYDKFGPYADDARGQVEELYIAPGRAVEMTVYPVDRASRSKVFVNKPDGAYKYRLMVCGQHSERAGGCLYDQDAVTLVQSGEPSVLVSSGGSGGSVGSPTGFTDAVRDFAYDLFGSKDKSASLPNYYCSGCSNNLAFDGLAFIKSDVNRDVSRWNPGDKVVITNGEKYVIFMYQANGNFVVIEAGDGVGPGEGKNHDKDETEGKHGGEQESAQPSRGGGGGSGGGHVPSPVFPPPTTAPPIAYEPSAPRRGTVTMEEFSPEDYYQRYS